MTATLFVSSDITLSLVRSVIHGARAAVLRIKRDRAPIGAWLDALDHRAPKNVVVVAMANKLARIAWAVLSSGNDYRPVIA
jgi:transposase